MFNSLNSTGEPLSDADIISAELYSKTGNERKEFNEKWEILKTAANDLEAQKIIDINAVLMQFMYINRALKKDSSVTTPSVRRYYLEFNKELLENPLKLCSLLNNIAEKWEKVKEYPIIKLLLKFNANIKLYLAVYLYRYEKEEITEKKLLEICESLLRLFTILEIVDAGYSSKNFKVFLFAEYIKLVDKNISNQDIKNDFNKHILDNWKKENLEEAVREYEKNALVYLNEYLYAKSKGTPFYLGETINIEHIMPSSGRNIESIRKNAGIEDEDEFNSLVNKIGNKILLEENINKSLGQDWFMTKTQPSIKKKAGYKASNYAIAKALTTYSKDKWEKDDIDKATEKAAARIIEFIFS